MKTILCLESYCYSNFRRVSFKYFQKLLAAKKKKFVEQKLLKTKKKLVSSEKIKMCA